MKDFVFITGNQHKADYLSKWLEMPIEHQKVDLEEIQSLDLATVVADKAKRAYDIVQRPVLVEDISLSFTALGRLPGTMVKWFLEEIGTEGLCKLLDPYADRRATASIMYGFFDGMELRTFEAHVPGTVPDRPRSLEALEWKNSLSWNSVFIPDDASKTYAEMTDEEVKPFSHRASAVAKLKRYLES